LNKNLAVIPVILVFLAIFIPLTSSSPDGLERVIANIGGVENEPFWKGVMSDYTVATIADPYVSTLLAGVFGTLMVLFAGFLLGKAMMHKETENPEFEVKRRR
jgi:hypothetical protein